MTVNYIVIHCTALHYNIKYTATHSSSDNKTRPINESGM